MKGLARALMWWPSMDAEIETTPHSGRRALQMDGGAPYKERCHIGGDSKEAVGAVLCPWTPRHYSLRQWLSFTAHTFTEFLAQNGIQYIRVVPYHLHLTGGRKEPSRPLRAAL